MNLKILAQVGAFLLASALSLTAQNSASCPFSPLPSPSGKFTVGTTILPIQHVHRTGSSRRVQLWYPAQPGSKAELAPYVPDKDALEVLRSQKFLDQPDCVFDAWAAQKTAAGYQSRPLATKQKFPLVLISPGAGMPRHAYTIYAQQLASDGFVTATIDYGPSGALTNAGRLVVEGPNEDSAAAFAIVAEDWADHISELLGELSGKHAFSSDLEREIARLIDFQRIGAMGHSLGGEASLIACDKDSHIRACVDLDGGLNGSKLEASGVKTTALLLRSHPLYSAADLARRHRTQEEFDEMGKKSKAEMQALFSKPGGDAWVISIAGTGHLSYSDAPYTMPTTISRFGGTIIVPDRLYTIVVRMLESYFTHAFDKTQAFHADEYPELTLQVSRT